MFSKEHVTRAIMLSMDNFGEWLVQELEDRELSQSDLARMSGLSRGTLSNIISGARGRGPESLSAIAKALKLPTEKIYRAAGLLPPAIKADEDMEQILHEIAKLPKDDQREVLAFIRMKNNLRKK